MFEKVVYESWSGRRLYRWLRNELEFKTENGKYLTLSNVKEFAFARLIKCGICGSGISADEKYKKLKDGSVNRHIYYLCTKSRNIDCKNKYVNENDLIDEPVRLVDEVHLDELGIKERVSHEFKRYNHFRMNVLGEGKENKDMAEVDVRNYAKYILREGSVIEKRELLIHLRSKLVIEDRKLRLE